MSERRFSLDHGVAFRASVVVIVAVWHLGYDIVIVRRGWDEYPSRAGMLTAYLVVLAVQVAGSVLVLRGRLGVATARTLAVVALAAGALATFGYPHGRVVSDVSWAWNTVGWLGVLLLMSRPLWELGILAALNTGETVAALALDGSLDRVMVARLITVAFATAGVQGMFAFVYAAIQRLARRTAEAAEAGADLAARQAAQDAVHSGRQTRYAELRDRAEPILLGLATGRLDPGDPAVQRRAGIAAARLRRLFAETDDAPHPLLHELRACADGAERRDVNVTILSYGELPLLSAEVRRTLTEPPMLVLAATRTWARLTVVGSADQVLVSIVADAPAEALAELPEGSVSIQDERDGEGNRLWVESRWDSPAPLTVLP
jgi:hypothetical protein